MIPGITDKKRLPRLGKIRLGEKRTSSNGKPYPAALDHFSFVDVPSVHAAFGDNCKELFPVLLPSDDEDVWFPTARKAYRASGLFCACSDGETAVRVKVGPENGRPGDQQGAAYLQERGLEVKDGDMFEMPCPGEDCWYFENKFCRNIGRLLFILPTVPGFGVYEITTTSYNGMVNVLNAARAVRDLAGRVSGIPFALVLKPIEVQPDGKKKTVYALHLEYRGSYSTLLRDSKQIEVGGSLALLGVGSPVEPEDPTPDDLMPHGGAMLDRTLEKPVSGARAIAAALDAEVVSDAPPTTAEMAELDALVRERAKAMKKKVSEYAQELAQGYGATGPMSMTGEQVRDAIAALKSVEEVAE